jgi:hypothetical protein
VAQLELSFFDLNKPNATQDENYAIAHDALQILLMGWPDKTFDWHALRSGKVLSAVFVKRNPMLLSAMRRAFQDGFEHLFQQLSALEDPELHLKQCKLYLSNCMNILPFSDLTPHENIRIPQYINQKWVMVEYAVNPIELTPKSGIQAIFIEDTDRVFAYGLEPRDSEHAHAHLIFMGTTYLVGQGAIPQIKADLTAFETPGEGLYHTGRGPILDWVEKQREQERPIDVCGMSLGGSLALLMALDCGDKLSEVTVLNPPGLHDPWFWSSPYDHWNTFADTQKPVVRIQKNNNDPVSRFGTWRKEWEIIDVVPPIDRRGPHSFADHAMNYAGFHDSTFNSSHVKDTDWQQRCMNVLIYTKLRALIYFTTVLPCYYVLLPLYRWVIRPIVGFLIDHIIAIALLLLIAALTIALFHVLPQWTFIYLTIFVVMPVMLYVVFNLLEHTWLLMVQAYERYTGLSFEAPAILHQPTSSREECQSFWRKSSEGQDAEPLPTPSMNVV